jgi:peptidoglycan/LPS O-acetylase OafA/YrhL
VATRRIVPALDGLRAIAIAWVLFTHFWTYPSSTPIVNRFAAAGWGGVDVFFVLSGFLITRILVADRESPGYYKRFYLRRARRIMPVYYLVLLVVLVGFRIAGAGSGLDQARHDWFWYVAFLSNVRLAQVGWGLFALDVTWSLAVEEQFYLAWPALVKTLGVRRLAGFCLGCAVLLPFVRLLLVETQWVRRPWLDVLTVFRMDNLAIGAFLACVETRIPAFRRLSAEAFVLCVGVLVGLTGAGFMERTSEVALVVGHSLLAVIAALIIQAALTPTSWLARICAWPPLRHFGRVSYGSYLYQGIVLAVVGTALEHFGLSGDHLADDPVLSACAKVVLFSACTYLVALASFTFYEEPILRGSWARKPRSTSAVGDRLT